MAVPLNQFKTFSLVLNDTDQEIYVTPQNKTSIILLLQITNRSDEPRSIDVYHDNNGQQIYLADNFEMPPRDTINLIGGKLVLEKDKKIFGRTDVSDDKVHVTASVLETLNE